MLLPLTLNTNTMASTSSRTQQKRVANLTSGIQILEEMELLYNPTNTNILLSNLNTIKQNLMAQ